MQFTGYYANVTSAGRCIHLNGSSSPDVLINSTDPAYVHVPFPEPGNWYVTLRSFTLEDNCECSKDCLHTQLCINCSCIRDSDTSIETVVSSSPCVDNHCNNEGKCVHYMSGGFVYSACFCFRYKLCFLKSFFNKNIILIIFLFSVATGALIAPTTSTRTASHHSCRC